MIIYKATNLVNGKIYIGKTLRSLITRKNRHISSANTGSNIYFHRAIRKYGAGNFVWEIIDRCLFAESLIALEKHYVRLFNCKSPNGYNLTTGGDGMSGFTFSEQTKEKMRLARIGKHLSEETRKKIGNAGRGEKNYNYGGHLSEEHKQKLSISHGGENCSAETRKKLRDSHVGKRPTEETRNKMRENHKDNSGKNHPNYGKPRSDEAKIQTSKSLRAFYAKRRTEMRAEVAN